MTLRLSTLLRQQLMGVRETYVASTIAAVDTPVLTDSASQFLIEGFRPGQRMEVSGFTGTAANDQLYVVGDVTAGSMVVTVEVALVSDAAGEEVTLTLYPQAFRFGGLYKASLEHPTSPTLVADTILKVAESGTWKLRHPVGPDAQPFLDWKASMTDEQWIDWNAASDEDWYNAVEESFGLDARKKVE